MKTICYIETNHSNNIELLTLSIWDEESFHPYTKRPNLTVGQKYLEIADINHPNELRIFKREHFKKTKELLVMSRKEPTIEELRMTIAAIFRKAENIHWID